METLNLATREKQDEILNNVLSNSGLDLSKYTSYSKELTGTDLLVKTKVLEINGAGLINYLEIYATTYDERTCEIEVIVDGKIMVNVKGKPANNISYIYNSTAVKYEMSESLPVIKSPGVGLTTTTSMGLPLFFNGNLVINVKSPAGVGATGNYYYVKMTGGVVS